MQSSALVNDVGTYCAELLGDLWYQFRDQIIVNKIKVGMGNRTFICSLTLNSIQSNVVVKLYGNEDLAGDGNQTKCLCESAEAVVFDRLASQGMAPKLLCLFSGGRIEEFIKGRTATWDDLNDISMYRAVARKLAHFHSQKMPISKTPLFIPLLKKHNERSKKIKDFSHLNEEQQEILRKLNEFPLETELDWSLNLAVKANSKVVFSHNDLFVFNIMIKDDGSSLFDKLLLIDYELSDHNNRGYDLALFLYGHEFEVIADESDNYYTYLGNTATDALKRAVAEQYLSELKEIGEATDENDNLEHLIMEIDVLALQFYLMCLVFVRLTVYDTNFNFGSLEYINDFIRLYGSQKEMVRKSYLQLFS